LRHTANRLRWKVDQVSPPFGPNPVHVVRAAETLYVPELGIQVVDGNILPEEAIHGSWELEFEIGRDFQGRGGAYCQPFEATYVDEDVGILSNLYSRNFGHWITEELVKVVILERYGFKGRFVVAGLPRFAAEFMHLLGISPDRIIDRIEGPTVFRSALLTTAIDEGNVLAHAGVFQALRTHILAASHAKATAPLASRLWMDRGTGVLDPGRGLIDAQETYAILERYGFKVIDMAALPLPAQIAAAHNAEILSGVHGAAFVHALFMKPRSTVIECFSPTFVNPSVLEICRMLDHRYLMLVHQNTYGSYPYGKRLKVSNSHLELTLQSLIQSAGLQ
jgi:capsular polysaccharide biosynthesis protein